MPSWDDLRFFLAIARAGTLSGAARGLRVDQTTVGRRLQALETRLETRLFDRTPDGYALTPAGERMVEPAQRIDDTVAELERQVAAEDTRPEGTVRLATSETLAAQFLGPGLGAFHARHPGIELELVTGNVSVNLLKREADLAVRVAPRPQQSNLTVRKLGELAWALYATPAYLKAHPRLEPARGLAGHEQIQFYEELIHIQPARWMAEHAAAARVAARTSSILGALALGAGGFGLTPLPCFIGDRHAELRRALPHTIGDSPEAWLVVHPDLARTARVRVVIDTVVELFSHEAPLLAGARPAKGLR